MLLLVYYLQGFCFKIDLQAYLSLSDLISVRNMDLMRPSYKFFSYLSELCGSIGVSVVATKSARVNVREQI